MPKRERHKPGETVTAAELLAIRANDEEYQRRRREREVEQAILLERLARDEAGLVRDLAAAGVVVTSVWDLVNTREAYPEAIPVLLDHLCQPHHIRIRAGIVRSLLVPQTRGQGFDILRREFLAISPDTYPLFELKWLLAGALAESVDDQSQLEQVIELIKQPKHGEAREGLLAAVVYLDEPERGKLLDSLANDPDLSGRVDKYRKRRRRRLRQRRR